MVRTIHTPFAHIGATGRRIQVSWPALNIVLLASVLIATAWSSGAQSAVASPGPVCSGSSGHTWTGWQVAASDGGPFGTYEGTSATITVRDGRVCASSSSPAFNTGWVMLSGNVNSATRGYVQVGFWQGNAYYPNAYKMYHFCEYNETGGGGTFTRYVQYFRGALSDGEQHHYFVQYSPSKGAEEMDIDVTNVCDSPFSPYSDTQTYFQKPWTIEWSSETIWINTDTPGYVNTQTVYGNMMAQKSSDDVFYPNIPTPLSKIYPVQSRFSQTTPSNRQFNTWTAS